MIFANYAATSGKKPDSVNDAIIAYLSGNIHTNMGRQSLIQGDDIVLETRILLSEYFNYNNFRNVIFTSGITMSLNMILLGLLHDNDHVISTTMEHNSVLRPLNYLSQTKNVEISYMESDKNGNIDLSSLEKLIKPNTKLLVMTHASNVTGNILPIEKCFEIAKKHNLITVLDSAQTAGYLEIDMQNMNIDILAFTGHKNLLGLSGIGGFIVDKDAAKKMDTVFSGGTGSFSEMLTQPSYLPDKFEPGTRNMIGIVSLNASIKYLNQTGFNKIIETGNSQIKYFCDKLQYLPVKIHGNAAPNKSVPVISVGFDNPNCDISNIADILADKYGIITRSGLHCAPLAHKSIGSYPTGTLRFSFGYDTTYEEMDKIIDALSNILTEKTIRQ